MFRRWILWQTALGVLSVGGLANAIVRKVSHTQAPTLEQVVHTLADFLFGPQTSGIAVAAGWAALLVLLIIIWFGLVIEDARTETVAWIIIPLATTLAISYTLKPLWHLHAIVPFAPFYAIVVAMIVHGVYLKVVGADTMAPWVIPIVMTLFLVVVGLGFVGWHLSQFQKETEYPWVARKLSDELREGDIVYIPQSPDFWGVARYSIDPDWGSPLAIQDLTPATDRWGKMVQRLSPEWRTRLHLDPQSDFVIYDGFRIYTGATTGERFAESRALRILVVQSRQPEVPTIPGYELVKVEEHDDIQLIYFRQETGVWRSSASGNVRAGS